MGKLPECSNGLVLGDVLRVVPQAGRSRPPKDKNGGQFGRRLGESD